MFTDWLFLQPTPKDDFEQRLTKIDDDLLELYRRTNMLLRVHESCQETMKSLLQTQQTLSKSQAELAETLKHMIN